MSVLTGSARLAARLQALSGLWCLMGLLALGGCAPALNWREFVLDDSDGLQVRFPCKPDQVERPLTWPESGESVVVRMHHCQADGMTWVVQSVAVASVAQVGPTLSAWPVVLRTNLRQATRSPVTEVRPAEDIHVPHMTPHPLARSVDLTAGPTPAGASKPWRRVRAWHFPHGRRVFEAAVWSIEDHKPAQTSEDVTLPFFDGLQFPG